MIDSPADAVELAGLLRRGELDPFEVLEATRANVESLDRDLNAFVFTWFDAAAEQLSKMSGDEPFYGVPMAVKDLNVHCDGQPYSAGNRALKEIGYRSDHDSVLVEKLRSAGFVVIGSTNTSELGMGADTAPVAHGPCRNPWNLEASSGGSSGGSAAAVASGLVTVAHGNDGGGSIRIPASMCGVVGLKQSRGRVSEAPDRGDNWGGAVVQGALTRSVRDAAALLDVMSGYVPGDPCTAPPSRNPFVEELATEPGALKVGLLTRPPIGGAGDPEAALAVSSVGELLESLGHIVEEASPVALAEPDFRERAMLVASVHVAHELSKIEAILGRPFRDADVEETTMVFGDRGAAASGRDYVEARGWLQAWSRRVASWWRSESSPEGFDILVTPTVDGPAPPIGRLADYETAMAFAQYLGFFNVTGQPAISLPMAMSADGLPIGVQLVADYARDALLLQLAAQLERARPWAHRRPVLDARTEIEREQPSTRSVPS